MNIVTVDSETLKRMIAKAVEAEREEFARHAVDVARRAIAEEREACAQLAEAAGPYQAADLIRARGRA